ncbi:Nitroreductase family protein [Tsuneonella dongtanensis]|uniref:Nitroreductase family protein n=1 Tax=Tsuneonella dongtanensis TaxID=692370 RepID=A0A1B2AF14_9SPHN|nr:nitroreductase family protein [Tsuneonella dongtanensis]ANY20734.1 Nitroreductase family protein [Tsuneonella dongtanensis]
MLKRIARHLKGIFALSYNAVRDTYRFYKWSSAVREPHLRSQLRARLTFVYHKLEKGLSMPDRRAGFGRDVATSLVTKLRAYEDAYGHDDVTLVVRDVLREYRFEMARDGIAVDEVERILGQDPVALDPDRRAGSVQLTRDDLFPIPREDAVRFLQARRSVRHFTGELVPREQIERVVRIAQRCPSVCNRQSGKVYACNDRETIDAALSYQNGNAGFGHLIGGLFIVVADVTRFNHVGERQQAFVDGGIFAMALLQALQAEGLGGCMLNWSMGYHDDNALRRRFALEDSVHVITMIGFGPTPDTFKVAASPRESVPIRWLGN